ncbi:MAG: hypothetical protein AAB525_04405, partial [Patescibacteria group bacterium]
QDLSDKQLAAASWLYERRTLFVRTTFFILIGAAGILFILFAVNLALYVIRYPNHQGQFLQTTQNFILAQDPALQFVPKDLQIQSINVIKHQGRSADFLAEVNNPNQNWLAKSFDYSFTADGNPLSTRSFFALPGIFYLAGFKADSEPFDKVGLQLNNIKWQKIKSTVDKERFSLLRFTVQDIRFVPGDKKEIVDAVLAAVQNSSPLGFWQTDIIALVYKDARLLAVGQGQIQELDSQEERAIEIGMGILNIDEVDRIKVIPQANILDKENIMQSL